VPRAPATRRSGGFTLIELLVVLMIMGLIVGLAAAIVRPDDRGLLRVEAERLAQLLDLAAAESRLTGTPIAWTTDGADYLFWRMTPEGDWTEVRDSDLLRARALPPGMRISGLRVENVPARGAMRLQFAPYYGASLSFTYETIFMVMRNFAWCTQTGEIAGYAAARSVQKGISPKALEWTEPYF